MGKIMTTYEQGRILRALGGFYYVQSGGTLYECKARGLFRNQGVSPLVGDGVRIQVTGEGTGFVEEIKPRKNSLIRPPVANMDALVMVVSMVSPPPNLLVLDKLIAIAEHKSVEPAVAVNKIDLCGGSAQYEEVGGIYSKAGLRVFYISSVTGAGVQELRDWLRGKVSCFCGNTGAGKSSILNCIDPSLQLQTDEISKKLGRGKHTTRHAQLYALAGGGYLADTPGFSAVELARYEVIRKEEMQHCFREFEPFLQDCRFTGCSHTSEPGCAVLEAAREGKIAKSRLESYKTLYEEAKKIKEWERGK